MSQPSSLPPGQTPNAASSTSSKKPRSPVEKLIVWGGILLLIGLVAFQARARVGYTMTLNALQERLSEDEGPQAKPLLLKDLGQYVVGWPSQKDEKKSKHVGVMELTWPGLSSSFGLTVEYDPSEEGGTVMGLTTRDFVEPPPPEQPPATGGALDATADEEAAGAGGPPAGQEPAADEPTGEPAATDPAAESPADPPAADQ